MFDSSSTGMDCEILELHKIMERAACTTSHSTHEPPSHTTSYLDLPVPRANDAIWHPAPQGRTHAALDFRMTPSQPPLAQARSHLLAVR
ncbi:hypothetical protein ONZ51_g13178 [Trametes cubensis]|uniref:Uncharacterized protein n=1 Tax=Trametes cubensis TaxID=1111947 RepID=A0AAD7TFU5_9APHY|nr:hypothetical protein ONZ51_g13178 [Trametes cubensis]